MSWTPQAVMHLLHRSALTAALSQCSCESVCDFTSRVHLGLAMSCLFSAGIKAITHCAAETAQYHNITDYSSRALMLPTPQEYFVTCELMR